MKGIEWLSGLLEGEGTFLLGPPRRRNRISIQVEMTDEDVIQALAREMGASTYRATRRHIHNPRWKQTYRVAIQGKKAFDLMILIRPMMSARRKSQIDKAISGYTDYSEEPCVTRRYVWPSDSKLLELRKSSGWRTLADRLGVSFMALRRRVARIEAAKLKSPCLVGIPARVS